MSTQLATARQDVRQRLLDAEHLVRASAGGVIRGQHPRWRRVELRPVELKEGPRLQVVTFDQTQSFTSNHAWGEDAEQIVTELVAEGFGHWHVTSTDAEFGFRVNRKGRVLVTGTAASHTQEMAHDRGKLRLVDAAAPFLHALGITDRSGAVKKSRADKYRQVEQFVRHLDAAVVDARSAGRLARPRLRVVDLGCGNAYLTFATYHHLAVELGLSVEVVGVDVKEQARRHNSEVASRLGWSSDVHFVEGTITEAEVATPVDITLALHACDTATDDALARGIGWLSELILAAPCCHHDIQRQLGAASPPVPYGMVTRYGLLRERWGDLLTDAIRAHLLRRSGYRTDLVEFVESQHTPRNLLLRGHLTRSGASAEQEAEYERLCNDWGVQPALERLLPQKQNPPT